jgi:hypothetical protein
LDKNIEAVDVGIEKLGEGVEGCSIGRLFKYTVFFSCCFYIISLICMERSEIWEAGELRCCFAAIVRPALTATAF